MNLNKKWSNNITNLNITNSNVDLQYSSNQNLNPNTPRAVEPLTPKLSSYNNRNNLLDFSAKSNPN